VNCEAIHRAQYIEVNEAYTSKTCGKCGFIDYELGSNHIYNCPKCKNKLDRDVNAARNILMKNKKLVLR
jgi:transposase